MYQWLKILGIFALAIFLSLGALSIAGKFLTSRIETEADPRHARALGPRDLIPVHKVRRGAYPGRRRAIEVLDALEIERAVAVGHSAGALTAVNLASNHPKRIRGAILTGYGLTVDPAQYRL